MTTISKVINELNISDWVLRGKPENEQQFNEMFKKILFIDGNAVESSNPDDWGITWAQVKEKLDELIAEEPTKLLREERDRRLLRTDWWALSDRVMSEEQILYRQTLRDITNNYTSLEDVIWPEEPK